MSIEEIERLPIADLSDVGCHVWLWTTNQFLHAGFELLESWGIKYMNAITWVKPSGFGAWWINRTQTCLFGYKDQCICNERYKPNVFCANAARHSEKPDSFYSLIESVSFAPRLELFARRRRAGWHCWGNEVASDIQVAV
jgi:N6-adenosine-specific RNA methylase IME4